MEERNKPSLEDLEKKINRLYRFVYSLFYYNFSKSKNRTERELISAQIDELVKTAKDRSE